METRKRSFLGYVVSIVVHLTLAYSPEGKTRTGGAPGLSEDSAGSTELVERCMEIDDDSLILLCRTHCKMKISKELTDIAQIDKVTWLNFEEAFAKNPNQCNCCKMETPLIENPTNNALLTETTNYDVFSSFGGCTVDDDCYKQLRILQDEPRPFVLISFILTFLIFWLCSCRVLRVVSIVGKKLCLEDGPLQFPVALPETPLRP